MDRVSGDEFYVEAASTHRGLSARGGSAKDLIPAEIWQDGDLSTPGPPLPKSLAMSSSFSHPTLAAYDSQTAMAEAGVEGGGHGGGADDGE